MQFIKYKNLNSIIVIVQFVSALAWASGGGEAPKAEGEGGADATAATSNESRADREWVQRTSKISGTRIRMEDARQRLEKLIEQKNHGHGHAPAAAAEGAAPAPAHGHDDAVLKEIASTHQEYLDAMAEYNKLTDQLRFRYPEEGTVISRKYLPYRPQSLDQIEREMGLDGELSRAKLRLDQKYAAFRQDEIQEKKEKENMIKQEGPESTYKKLNKKKSRAPASHSDNAEGEAPKEAQEPKLKLSR